MGSHVQTLKTDDFSDEKLGNEDDNKGIQLKAVNSEPQSVSACNVPSSIPPQACDT